MGSFDLSEELARIQATVRDFASREIRPALRQVEKDGVPAALAGRYSELGLLGLDWPEAAGGQGMDAMARVLVEEELAAGDLGTAFVLDRGGAAATFLKAVGTGRAFGAMRSLLADHRRGVLAMAEEGKAREDFQLAARPRADAWVLTGAKAHVLGAEGGAWYVVLAQVEPGRGLSGAGAFLVPADSTGLRVGRMRQALAFAPLRVCELLLDSVAVALQARLDDAGQLPLLLRRFYDSLSLVTAARAVGAARTAYEYALRYADERTAFGKPIGHFQAIAFLLADMATHVDAARLLLWKAAWQSERGVATGEIAAAQVQALETAFFCANNAVQILGGAGYVQDHPVEKWMREVKMLALYGLHAQAAEATLAAAELGGSLTAPELFPIPSLHPALS